MAAFSSMASMAFLTFALSENGNIVSSSGIKGVLNGSRLSSDVHTSVCPWRRECDVQRPLLPTNLFFRFCEPCFLSLFLKKLNRHQTTHPTAPRTTIGAGIELTRQRRRPLLDQRFQLDILNKGKCQAQDVACAWPDRGKEPVEEDCVEDSCVYRVSIWARRLAGTGFSSLLSKIPWRGGQTVPLTTSLTDSGDANTSMMYSGVRR